MQNEPILNSKKIRVLSIYPSKTGLSFSYFESPRELIDWGNCHFKHENFREKIDTFVDHFNPDILITEDYKGSGYLRGTRIISKLDELYRFTEEKNVFLKKYSPSMIKGIFDCFEVHTKHEIASLLTQWYPALSIKLPPKPKSWSNDHHNFPIFNSVALAFAYFYTEAN